jgi:phosphohistidine phosphatase
MKTVFLMRHAKAKRGPEYEVDFERPLAKRGKGDAARVGEFLRQQGRLPDLILSSPAERARDTTLRCAEAAGYEGEIRFEERLYFAGDDACLDLLLDLDDVWQSAMIVGHNPDIAEAVEALSGEWARMPTAALARIDFDATSWSELAQGRGHLRWVQEPRDL